MAQSKATTFRFDTSPDKLLEVLLDPDFQVAREKVQGSVSATVKDLRRTDAEYNYEVHTVDYAKTLTGIDRKKTETATCTYEWDLSRMRCVWDWVGPHGRKARTWGNLRISPAGGGATMDLDFNIDIKVPLVGKKIENLVLKEVEPGWVRYENVIREWLSK